MIVKSRKCFLGFQYEIFYLNYSVSLTIKSTLFYKELYAITSEVMVDIGGTSP